MKKIIFLSVFAASFVFVLPVSVAQSAVQPECNIRCLRYDPACGENGQTYGCGEPEALCYGVKVIAKTECSKVNPCLIKKSAASRFECSRRAEQEKFETYLKANIGQLSKVKPVLGGKFYVTKISWKPNREAIVEYEDGHIAVKASAKMGWSRYVKNRVVVLSFKTVK